MTSTLARTTGPTRSIGILLLAHAPLATAFARVAADLGLDVSGLMRLDMAPDMSREQALAAAKMLMADSQCEAFLVLIDLGGGCSPFAVGQSLQNAMGDKVRVVAGLNSAMLVTALCHHDLDLDALAEHAMKRGSDGIQAVRGVQAG